MYTSENGGSMAPGNAFTIVCAAMCTSRKDVSGHQALQSLTRDRSKQQTEFEHNYGQGKQNLATILALLMFLAFTVNQMIQRCRRLFRQARGGLRTKAKPWDSVRSLFKVLLLSKVAKTWKNMSKKFRDLETLWDSPGRVEL